MKTKVGAKALLSKGFRKASGDHDFYTFFKSDGETEIRTKISHGETEIGSPLISMMQKQMLLTKQEFVDFVDCRMSGQKYLETLTSEYVFDPANAHLPLRDRRGRKPPQCH